MTEQPPSAEAYWIVAEIRAGRELVSAASEIDALVEQRVSAERERCIKVCDERSQWAESKVTESDEARWATYSLACDDCAEMIRAPAESEKP